MSFYSIRKAFLATIASIRRTNANYNAAVSTRQVVRARLRRRYFKLVEGETRKERRQLSRAYAAGEWKAMEAAK